MENKEKRLASQRRYREKHRDEIRLKQKIWRESHREAKLAQSKRWRDKHPHNHRKYLESKYGVSYPTWWLCDICSKPISLYKGEIKLDHDHKTGRFRSWLCIRCNTGLGWLDSLGIEMNWILN